jgi:hypothetical protein
LSFSTFPHPPGGFGFRSIRLAASASASGSGGGNAGLAGWTMALHLMTAGKKGYAAKQFQRQSGLSYKSSLFLLNRIRYAMADEPHEMLLGTVEVDEGYIGGNILKDRRGR